MNTASAGQFLPLFDRIGGELLSSVDGRMLDAGGLRQSLRHDLTRLLNVRNGLTIDQFLHGAPSSLTYGIPDILGLSPQSAGDMRLLQQIMEHAISLYEPRLSHVHVHVSPDHSRPMAVRGGINASVALAPHPCEVHFEITLDGQAMRLVSAHEGQGVLP